MIQQGKYRDYSAVGLFGVSPTVIANIPEHAASYEGVSADPRGEPAAFAGARDITLVVVPHMAHMHNFADTREQLWERFHRWLEGGRS